jgi:Family of unknown function (DUF6064)
VVICGVEYRTRASGPRTVSSGKLFEWLFPGPAVRCSAAHRPLLSLSPTLSTMAIPFTVEQFYGVFCEYNNAVWPAQGFLVATALATVVAALRPRSPVSASLGVLWAWIALAYHLAFLARITPPAYAFAALSMVGAAAFIWEGVIRRRLSFQWVAGPKAVAGAAFIVFALVVYPVWSAYAGHSYPRTPTFGLPCPTTIFTIGLLCFAVPPTPRSPLIVPVLRCLVGAQAAFLLGVQPDLGLIAAGLLGMGLLAAAARHIGKRNHDHTQTVFRFDAVPGGQPSGAFRLFSRAFSGRL